MSHDDAGGAPERSVWRRDAAGVVWRTTLRLAQLGGRWEVTGVNMESSHGQGRLTATLLRSLQSDVMRVRADMTDPSEDDGSGGFPGDLDGSDYIHELAADFEQGPTPVEPVEVQPTNRRGPRPDDERWAARVEAMAAAWAQGRPMVQALQDLEPGFTRATYSARVTRARRWAREHGDTRLDGVGRAR